jgi:hypothetical protein
MTETFEGADNTVETAENSTSPEVIERAILGYAEVKLIELDPEGRYGIRVSHEEILEKNNGGHLMVNSRPTAAALDCEGPSAPFEYKLAIYDNREPSDVPLACGVFEDYNVVQDVRKNKVGEVLADLITSIHK